MDRDLGVTGEERTPGPQGQAGDKVLLVLLQKSGAAGQVEDRQRLGGYPTRQKPEEERLPGRRSRRDAARPSV